MAKYKSITRKTIVTLTTVPVLGDSRAMKIAASFARWNYNSIAIEGGISNSNEPLSFGLISSGSPSLQIRNSPMAKNLYYAVANRVPPLLTSFLSNIKQRSYFDSYKVSYMFHYRDMVRRVLPEADLYLLRSYLQYPAIKGKPFIYDASDFYSALRDNNDDFERKRANPFHYRIEQECMKKALAVTTVSGGLVSLFTREFGRKPEIIMNCYDKRLDIPTRQTLKNMLGLTSLDFLAVVIGTAKDGMAISTAIEALGKLPDNVHIAFVGKGHKDYGSRTHSVGAVPANEVVPFISDADCVLIPYFDHNVNYRYCLPNSLFQGIAAKLPILYPMLPEIAHLAAKYSIGLSIDALNPDSIALAINELIAHKSIFGLETAAQELSWEKEEQKLKAIVERLLQ